MPLVQGLGFPGGETMIEPWLFMNSKRTYEYLYTAQTVTAEEALSMGMVNRVVHARSSSRRSKSSPRTWPRRHSPR